MELRKMWTQMSCVYFLLTFGVYCYVLPSSILAKQHRVKFSGSKGLTVLSKLLADDPNYQHEEFKNIVKPLLIDRMPDTDNSRKVQQYITSFFEKLDWTIEKDEFDSDTPWGMKHFTNIIVTHNPFASRKLVVACHYDSKNLTDPRNKNKKFIGATDSAVPCAIMMDVAKRLDCMLRKPSGQDLTLQMLFLDGEEAYQHWTNTDSLYGSRHLANLWKHTPDPALPSKTRLESIDLFVLLDLIGTNDVHFQRFIDGPSAYFDALQKTEEKLWKAELLNPNAKETNGQPKQLFKGQTFAHVEDDHIPFIRNRGDLPVLHLISSPFPSVWHRMSDNKENIDYHVTDNFNRVFRVFVANFLHLQEETCKKK